MMKRMIQTALLLSASMLLFACGGEKFELKVKANMNGQPAAQARVSVDGQEQGLTDSNGDFAKNLERKAGTEVAITVTSELPGRHTNPWKGSFVVKASRTAEVYSFTAELTSAPFVTIKATSKDAPLSDAVVKVGGKEAGRTDAKGEFLYEYKEAPAKGLDISVSKTGYGTWHKTAAVEPGQQIEAALNRRVTVTINALSDEYGQQSGVPGISVSINNTTVGKTNARGALVWSSDKELGKKVPVVLSAPGYLPETWQSSITLDGEVRVQRYFYPVTPRPIRTGIYRFAGNTPNVDLRDVLTQTEDAIAAQLYKNTCFSKVPSQTLQNDMKRAKVSIEKVTTKGWRTTPLRKSVDMIVVGSVAKDDKGYLIEAKFYASGGIQIISQIARAKSASDIPGAAKEIVNAVIERFPFEGTVVGTEEERYRINLGKAGYRISRGTDFEVMTPRMDDTGKITAYREAGRLRVRKAEDGGSWAEVEELKKDGKISVGDRVFRRVYREGEEEGSRNVFILSAKGGIPPDTAPLGGVNIYVNNEWLGATGPDGKAEVPARINKSVTLLLYRHGYQQVTEKITIGQNKETKEFILAVNNALFRVDSHPQGAEVFVDDEQIGKTPLLAGKAVPLGFHTVKVTVGGDYRDWEEVVEFSKKEEDRTGERSIVLPKDWLKIGERAEQKGEVDGAITAYQSAEKGHPDYSVAHHRLAQLYLDDKADFDGAIREFENVLSLPENQQLIYKQFSVAFMNLGHAYYEKGSALVQKDREAAAQNFGKAIQNLQIAKQNMRFFPNDRYDEAVHDTYYYTALAYHKLYQLTKKGNILNSANQAWQDYFDFFPKKLEANDAFEQSREAARKYWDQIKNL